MLKLYVSTGTAKAFIADNLFLEFNSDLRMSRRMNAIIFLGDNIHWLFSPSSQSCECHYSHQYRGICMPPLRRGYELKSCRQLTCLFINLLLLLILLLLLYNLLLLLSMAVEDLGRKDSTKGMELSFYENENVFNKHRSHFKDVDTFYLLRHTDAGP